jgi:hypothetical protein
MHTLSSCLLVLKRVFHHFPPTFWMLLLHYCSFSCEAFSCCQCAHRAQAMLPLLWL